MEDGNGIGSGDSCGLKRCFRCLVGLSGLGDYGVVSPSPVFGEMY